MTWGVAQGALMGGGYGDARSCALRHSGKNVWNAGGAEEWEDGEEGWVSMAGGGNCAYSGDHGMVMTEVRNE